ncbi:hypothetical protein RI138_01125 [Streptomyces sp. C11-1]|uniref:Uncharacterized protein n=1 Tax=Streptomyces durocortorensis TaxID=2811104 RepID=A0ABY9VWY6_9ACTN|nr:hypothetical protein [Streptomyces durocortorensis]WNF25516.1 hypothetical protein RI138_01125 [Streptomyces durocortorensis]
MNSTPEQSGADHPAGREVVVSLSRGEAQDVRTVFDVLADAFESDRRAGEIPGQTQGHHPTAWVTTVDVSEPRPTTAPVRLSAPVTVDAQGGYWAVDRLRDHLGGAFAVSVVGTAAGDQELEVRLRLESR